MFKRIDPYATTNMKQYQLLNKMCGYFEGLIKHLTLDKHNVFVVGGSIRDYFEHGYITADLDLMFETADDKDIVQVALNGDVVFKNSNVVKVSKNDIDIDLIGVKFAKDACEAIAQFDFTICCFGLQIDKGRTIEAVYHDDYFHDLVHKRLRINKLSYPLATLQRLQKFIRRGWTVDNSTLVNLAHAIQYVDLSDPTKNPLEFYSDGRKRK